MAASLHLLREPSLSNSRAPRTPSCSWAVCSGQARIGPCWPLSSGRQSQLAWAELWQESPHAALFHCHCDFAHVAPLPATSFYPFSPCKNLPTKLSSSFTSSKRPYSLLQLPAVPSETPQHLCMHLQACTHEHAQTHTHTQLPFLYQDTLCLPARFQAP